MDRGCLTTVEHEYMDVPKQLPNHPSSAGLGLGTARKPDAVDELARLTSAHQQLLRYARDLKRAYETEREQRTRLAQATLDLLTVLATSMTPDRASTGIGGAVQAA